MDPGVARWRVKMHAWEISGYIRKVRTNKLASHTRESLSFLLKSAQLPWIQNPLEIEEKSKRWSDELNVKECDAARMIFERHEKYSCCLKDEEYRSMSPTLPPLVSYPLDEKINLVALGERAQK